MGLSSLDGTESINIDAAVIIVLAAVGTAGHQPCVGDSSGGRMRIRRFAEDGAVALASGVYDEVAVARLRPARVLVGQAAPSGITDIFDDDRQPRALLTRRREVQ